MEFTFTPLRVAVFVIALVVFWLVGGFTFPAFHSMGLKKAWLTMNALYVLGAISMTVVDHWVGNLDRSNLRFLYIIMGVIACSGGLMYLHILKERAAIEQSMNVAN